MKNPLILNTKQAADFLGMSLEKFRLFRQQQDCPVKPLPYMKGRYYQPALQLYLDSISGIKPQSDTWNDKIMQGLAYGGDSSALPCS